MTGDADDGTQEQPAKEPAQEPAQEPTQEQPPATGPSGTAVLPPVPEGEERPVWAGRAAVPTPPPSPQVYPELPAEAPRSVLIPVLVTICVMLLLGVFAVGVWLILANGNSPAPTEPPTATSTPAPTTARSSAGPAEVVIPLVTDGSADDAANRLRRLGLQPDLRQEHADAPAGTVLGTDPPAGTTVRAGSRVTIIVSLGPEPVPTTTAAAPTATPTATAT